MRVAYPVSVAMAGVLPQTPLFARGGRRAAAPEAGRRSRASA